MSVNPKPKKPKALKYGKPPIQALVKRQATLAAKDVEKVQELHKRTLVRRLVVKGKTYDQISKRLGITTTDAVNIVKDITKTWLTEESIDSTSLREIEIQKLKAAHSLAMHEAFPHPMTDDLGQPILVRSCNCITDATDPMFMRPCVFEDHNKPAMSKPDPKWMDVFLEIGKRISAMLGLDAADKLKEKIVDKMERVYKGVDSRTINDL